jgi:hypothetical protein
MIGGSGIPAKLFGKQVHLPISIVKYAPDAKILIYIAYNIRDKHVL